MITKEIYLHIGFPRTGTSFLQSQIFPNLGTVNYMRPMRRIAHIKSSAREKNNDVKMRGLFKLLSDVSRRRLTDDEFDIAHQHIADLSLKTNIISDEGIFDYKCYNCNGGDVPHMPQHEILDGLKRMFDGFDIKIILGLREQSGLITSLYKYYVSYGGTEDIIGFLSWLCKYNFSIDAPFFKRFEFSNDIEAVINVFGKENMHIYLAENMRSNQQQTLDDMMYFMGENRVPFFDKGKIHNRGYGARQIRIARFLNRFFKTEMNPKGVLPVIDLPFGFHLNPKLLLYRKFVQRLIYTDYKLPPAMKRKIKAMYIEDNEKINKKYELNLPSNYFLGGYDPTKVYDNLE